VTLRPVANVRKSVTQCPPVRKGGERALAVEVSVPTQRLDRLADEIRVAHRRGEHAAAELVEAYFVIGRCLAEARELLRSNQAFGEWLRSQGFPFGRTWAHRLRQAAELAPEVRAELSSQLDNGGSPNIDRALTAVRHARGGSAGPLPLGRYRCLVVDPPWAYENTAHRGAAAKHYDTMEVDELLTLELPAAEQAHLWLWSTNTHLPNAFAAVEGFGFRYVTLLTWVKPGLGLGSYLRSTTEHCLFAVRGRLRPLRRDVPTHLHAQRGRHSAKPKEFFDLVEAISPGPRVELFARGARPGWDVWGIEAAVTG
jgi:N6-adenosine-specific RNA methylase IME4